MITRERDAPEAQFTWPCKGNRARCMETGFCQAIVQGDGHCTDGKRYNDREGSND